MSDKIKIKLIFILTIITNIVYMYLIISNKANFLYTHRRYGIFQEIMRLSILFLPLLIVHISKNDVELYQNRFKYIIPLVIGIVIQCILSIYIPII